MAGVNIYYSGIQQCKSNHFWGPDVRRHYVLHFVLGGKGIYRTGKKEFQIQSGEAFIINPQETVFYKADELEPWEYAWIAFDGEDVKGLIGKLLDRENYIFEFTKCAEVKENFLNLIHAMQEKDIGKRILTSIGYFYLVLSSVSTRSDSDARKSERNYMDKALEYIEYHYSFEIKISDVCDAVGLERSYLFKLFKKYKEESPKSYLSNYRLTIAQEMLRYTEHNTTEISMACGFHDASTFCKSFIRKFGVSPQRYRKAVRAVEQYKQK